MPPLLRPRLGRAPGEGSDVWKNEDDLSRFRIKFCDEDFVPMVDGGMEDVVRAIRDLDTEVAVAAKLKKDISSVKNGTFSQTTIARMVITLLEGLGYDAGDNMMVIRYVTEDTAVTSVALIDLNFGPEHDDAGTVAKHRDIYLADCNTGEIKLLVHPERQRWKEYAQARIVEKAIGAFLENEEVTGKDASAYTFLAMVMLDNGPIFYQIPVTRHLVHCVKRGKQPRSDTVVKWFEPVFPPDALDIPACRETMARYLAGFRELFLESSQCASSCL